MVQMNDEKTSQARIEGLDWLRALMSFAVVTWHMGIVPRSNVFSAERLTSHSFSFSDFINFHVLLAAVPVFLAISCFLFARKQQNIRRLLPSFWRVLLLLMFWPVALKLWQGSIGQIASEVPLQPLRLIVYLCRAGETIYYFFVCLLFCYAICYIASALKTKWVLLAFVVSSIGLDCLAITAQVSRVSWLTVFWSPVNFVPFALGSVLVARVESNDRFVRNRNSIALACMGIATVLAICEWTWMVDAVHFGGNGYALPAYTRTSLAFTAFGLLLIGFDPRIRTNVIVQYFAMTSLSLYCLHPFFMAFGELAEKKIDVFQSIHFASLLLVILLSNIGFHVGKLFLKKELLH